MGKHKLRCIRDPYLRRKAREIAFYAAARKAWMDNLGLPAVKPSSGMIDARARTVRLLVRQGVKAADYGRTLFTGRLSPGCRACLAGESVNYVPTFGCNRSCFFCYQPRNGNGTAYSPVIDLRALMKRKVLRSFSISGGEPLLEPERVLAAIRAVRRRFPRSHIHLYTNGTRATRGILAALGDAGLDEIRFNLRAADWRLDTAMLARRYIPAVAAEIPVIPGEERMIRALMLSLERAGIGGLNLHELLYFGYNREKYRKLGCVIRDPGVRPSYTEAAVPVMGSDEAALRLLSFAAGKNLKLNIHYCSCAAKQDVQHVRKRRFACREHRRAHERPTRHGLLERTLTRGDETAVIRRFPGGRDVEMEVRSGRRI